MSENEDHESDDVTGHMPFRRMADSESAEAEQADDDGWPAEGPAPR